MAIQKKKKVGKYSDKTWPSIDTLWKIWHSNYTEFAIVAQHLNCNRRHMVGSCRKLVSADVCIYLKPTEKWRGSMTFLYTRFMASWAPRSPIRGLKWQNWLRSRANIASRLQSSWLVSRVVGMRRLEVGHFGPIKGYGQRFADSGRKNSTTTRI